MQHRNTHKATSGTSDPLQDAQQIRQHLMKANPILSSFRRNWILVFPKWARGMNRFMKRTLDILGSSILLILLTPLFMVTAVAILIEDGRPLFYNQIRVSKGGRKFKMFKFRSMFNNADRIKETLQSDAATGSVIFKMKHDPRITRTGRIIRKLSIDELPQLWNVLRGDLTLVGPRPPIPSEVAQYSSEDLKRLSVTPGLTCIWQVSGRSDIDFDTQVVMDAEYIKTQSFIADLKLLFRTIPAVLTGKGAY